MKPRSRSAVVLILVGVLLLGACSSGPRRAPRQTAPPKRPAVVMARMNLEIVGPCSFQVASVTNCDVTLKLVSGLNQTDTPCLVAVRDTDPVKTTTCRVDDSNGKPASIPVRFTFLGCRSFTMKSTGGASSAFYFDVVTGKWAVSAIELKGRMHQHDATTGTDIWPQVTQSKLTINNRVFGDITMSLKGSLARASGNCLTTRLPSRYSLEAIAQ